MTWQRRGQRRIGGVFYPHRLGVQHHFDDLAVEGALVLAHLLEVRVYRMDPQTFRFVGGPGRIDISTTTPGALTLRDLSNGTR